MRSFSVGECVVAVLGDLCPENLSDKGNEESAVSKVWHDQIPMLEPKCNGEWGLGFMGFAGLSILALWDSAGSGTFKQQQ